MLIALLKSRTLMKMRLFLADLPALSIVNNVAMWVAASSFYFIKWHMSRVDAPVDSRFNLQSLTICLPAADADGTP